MNNVFALEMFLTNSIPVFHLIFLYLATWDPLYTKRRVFRKAVLEIKFETTFSHILNQKLNHAKDTLPELWYFRFQNSTNTANTRNRWFYGFIAVFFLSTRFHYKQRCVAVHSQLQINYSTVTHQYLLRIWKPTLSLSDSLLLSLDGDTSTLNNITNI